MTMDDLDWFAATPMSGNRQIIMRPTSQRCRSSALSFAKTRSSQWHSLDRWWPSEANKGDIGQNCQRRCLQKPSCNGQHRVGVWSSHREDSVQCDLSGKKIPYCGYNHSLICRNKACFWVLTLAHMLIKVDNIVRWSREGKERTTHDLQPTSDRLQTFVQYHIIP